MEEWLDFLGLVPEVEYGPLFQMTVVGDRFWLNKEERSKS